MGKARGKVGNVVLNTNHGITIAKQCPVAGQRKASPAQVTAKQKFSSAYQYYIFQKLFISNARKLVKFKEQIYNGYLRNFYSILPIEAPITLLDSFLPFIDSKIGYEPSFQPLGIYEDVTDYWLVCNTIPNEMKPNVRIRVILIETSTGKILNRSFKCLIDQWNVGQFKVYNTFGLYDYGAFYLYHVDRSILSEIYYAAVNKL